MLSSLSSTAVAFLVYPVVFAASSSVLPVFFSQQEVVGATWRREKSNLLLGQIEKSLVGI